MFKRIIFSLFLMLSFNINAVVINTLNDVNYEWLELTETTGLTRDQVELRLADSNDALYGYEYASRQLLEDLFLSYAPWDGLNGWHGDPQVIAPLQNLIYDFGPTSQNTPTGNTYTVTTVDGHIVQYEAGNPTLIQGIYGEHNECSIPVSASTCLATAGFYADINGNLTMIIQDEYHGWDANYLSPDNTSMSYASSGYGSFLVRDVSPVPVPSALWLFGSGLIGLIGLAKRKRK